jgi:hypothetical protein
MQERISMKNIRRYLGSRPRLLAFTAVAIVIALVVVVDTALAAGGKPATKLVNVADTRGITSDFSLWLAGVYNTNLWLFGALVVTIMAAMGAGLGLMFDKALGLLGIQLGRLEHHE